MQPNSVRDFVITDIFGNGDVLVSMVEAEVRFSLSAAPYHI